MNTQGTTETLVRPKQRAATTTGELWETSPLTEEVLPTAPPAKRVMDVCGSILIILALLPVLLVVAALVAVTSQGPVLFHQRRVGRDGETFKMWKFRSMRVDAEEMLANDPELRRLHELHDFKLPEGQDPRITSVGGFIRRTSIDELPQLFNVLFGQMSLVGPRPVRHREVARYGSRVGFYTAVRPGMTGLWQVSGRSSIEFPERAELDESYVRSMSIRNDLVVLLRTIPAVVRGDGAH